MHPSASPLQVAAETIVFLAILSVVLLVALDLHRRGMARVTRDAYREESRLLDGIRAAAAIPDDSLDAITVVHLPRTRPSSSWDL